MDIIKVKWNAAGLRFFMFIYIYSMRYRNTFDIERQKRCWLVSFYTYVANDMCVRMKQNRLIVLSPIIVLSNRQ